MNVAVMSLFRNSAGQQIKRYGQQVANLRDALHKQKDRMRVIAVYGDCTDHTEQDLINRALDHNYALTLVEVNHNGPHYGSTEQPERLKALSYVINGGLEAVLPQDDIVFYVESDLLWEADTVVKLIQHLKDQSRVDMVAPLVFAGEHFYDIFVFRKNGERFGPFAPYHRELNHDGTLTVVDSVGSGFVMRAEVARNCRINNDQALLGFCEDVWAHGWNINVDASLRIHHP